MDTQAAGDIACWYAIRTKSKEEERAVSNLEAWRVETFAPMVRTQQRSKHGDSTLTSKPLFPQYIFARFKADELLHKIRFTRGVNSVVSFGGYPVPVRNEIIDAIKSRQGVDGFIRIGEELKPGDRVLINDGTLKSLTGIFERRIKSSNRVAILLTAINYEGRAVINSEMVEKLA
jgi:transcriptional antiterminator RfaH